MDAPVINNVNILTDMPLTALLYRRKLLSLSQTTLNDQVKACNAQDRTDLRILWQSAATCADEATASVKLMLGQADRI